MNERSTHYRTIAAAGEASYRVLGSRHLAFAFPVRNEEDIRNHLELLRKEHPHATHLCYAWRIGPEKIRTRSNDDGEPSGTAGKPILGQIQSFDLTNVLVCVVRYFGGTKLGTGGLIDAYRTASRMALESSTVVENPVQEHLLASFPYDALHSFLKLLKDLGLNRNSMNTGDRCTVDFDVPISSKRILETRLEDLKIKGINILIETIPEDSGQS